MGGVFWELEVFDNDTEQLVHSVRINSVADDEVRNLFDSGPDTSFFVIEEKHLSKLKNWTGVSVDLSTQSANIEMLQDYDEDQLEQQWILSIEEGPAGPAAVGRMNPVLTDKEIRKTLRYAENEYLTGITVDESHQDFIFKHSDIDTQSDKSELFIDLDRDLMDDGKSYGPPYWKVREYNPEGNELVRTSKLFGVGDQTVRETLTRDINFPAGYCLGFDEDPTKVEFIRSNSQLDFDTKTQLAYVELYREQNEDGTYSEPYWRVTIYSIQIGQPPCEDTVIPQDKLRRILHHFELEGTDVIAYGMVRENDLDFIKEELGVEIDLNTHTASIHTRTIVKDGTKG